MYTVVSCWIIIAIYYTMHVIFIVITLFHTCFDLEDRDQGQHLIHIILTRVQTITDFTFHIQEIITLNLAKFR